MGSASSLVTCKELYVSFWKCWLPHGTFYLGHSRSHVMRQTEICSNFSCVDGGISFGISLYEPRLSECTLTFEKSPHLYKLFSPQKRF